MVQLQATISNLNLEADMRKKEKASMEATNKELKKEAKELRNKLKTLTEERSAVAASESTNDKAMSGLSDEVERLRTELDEKSASILEGEMKMY